MNTHDVTREWTDFSDTDWKRASARVGNMHGQSQIRGSSGQLFGLLLFLRHAASTLRSGKPQISAEGRHNSSKE